MNKAIDHHLLSVAVEIQSAVFDLSNAEEAIDIIEATTKILKQANVLSDLAKMQLAFEMSAHLKKS